MFGGQYDIKIFLDGGFEFYVQPETRKGDDLPIYFRLTFRK